MISENIEQTYAVAALVAAKLTGGEVVLLKGELGAGKTAFVKGLAKALGVKAEVVSPTFTFLKEYQGKKLILRHIDTYRLETEKEALALGLKEAFSDNAVVAIEWNKFSNIKGKKIIVDIIYDGDDKRIFNIDGIKL